MQQRTVIRSTTMFLGLLLMSLLLLFAVNEYEKSREFQWQNMVQPHWEGEVPQAPLLLPLATEKADAVVIASDIGKGEVDLAQPQLPEKDVEPSVEEIKKPEAVKKTELVSNVAAVVVKNKPQPQVEKNAPTPKKALRLRMKEDLYYGHTSRWEVKKQKEMPDFFAQKTNPDDVRLGGHLIMEGDDNSTASRNNQDKKNGDGGYLDAIQGAELKISIPMR